jgi:hypothetical protein
MKKILILIFLSITILGYAQIITQETTDGSVIISPRGIEGKTSGNGSAENVGLGTNTLKSITKGSYNVAIGRNSLSSSTTGFNNIGIGDSTLFFNNSDLNIAIGSSSIGSNISGFQNIEIGTETLHQNATGRTNVAVGMYPMQINTTGYSNSAFNNFALNSNTTGYRNTSVGSTSMISNTIGNQNTSIGYFSLSNNTNGANNTGIGSGADVTLRGLTNATAIGFYAKVNDSNKVRIGNTAVTVIEGQVAWSNPSDRRLKENIVYTPKLGLDFINRLQTASYNYIDDKNKIRYDGFIAQDIEGVMKDLNLPFSGLKKSADGYYSLAYSDFVMPLVNAVKEQQIQISVLKKMLDVFEQKLTVLENTTSQQTIQQASK